MILIGLFPILAAAYQTRSFLIGGSFTLGLAIALASLMLVAMGLLFLVRRFFPRKTFIRISACVVQFIQTQ
jgi:putative ABC transport system permease protein